MSEGIKHPNSADRLWDSHFLPKSHLARQMRRSTYAVQYIRIRLTNCIRDGTFGHRGHDPSPSFIWHNCKLRLPVFPLGKAIEFVRGAAAFQTETYTH